MPQNKEKKVRAQIMFESNALTQRLFNAKTATDGLTIKSIMGRFIEAYLADDPAALQVASGESTPFKANTLEATPQDSVTEDTGRQHILKLSEHSEWIEMLEGILSSGHAVAIEAVIRNLQAFDVLVRSNAGGIVGNYQVPGNSELAGNIARKIKHLERAKAAERSRDAANTKRAG